MARCAATTRVLKRAITSSEHSRSLGPCWQLHRALQRQALLADGVPPRDPPNVDRKRRDQPRPVEELHRAVISNPIPRHPCHRSALPPQPPFLASARPCACPSIPSIPSIPPMHVHMHVSIHPSIHPSITSISVRDTLPDPSTKPITRRTQPSDSSRPSVRRRVARLSVVVHQPASIHELAGGRQTDPLPPSPTITRVRPDGRLGRARRGVPSGSRSCEWGRA